MLIHYGLELLGLTQQFLVYPMQLIMMQTPTHLLMLQEIVMELLITMNMKRELIKLKLEQPVQYQLIYYLEILILLNLKEKESRLEEMENL